MNLDDIKIKKDVSILFMGTPEFCVPILEGLIANYKVRAILTQPDKIVGRKGVLTSPPAKLVAEKYTILCLQPEKIKDAVDEIISLKPTLIVTCAYGQILPRELLVYPEYGCINVHASLLPKLRGGAPIHRAIINGNKETGITIMHMNPKMDEGDIIASEKIEILDDDTTETLHDKLSVLGRDLLLKTLPSIIEGTAPRIVQDSSLATYAPNISKDDEKITFNKTTRQIFNQIRGLNSWPGAYAIFEGKRIKVWESRISDNSFNGKIDGQITSIYDDGIGIKVENGEIVFTIIQPEGKPKMRAVDFVNGYQDKNSLIGKVFE